jgi:hypothetical protein
MVKILQILQLEINKDILKFLNLDKYDFIILKSYIQLFNFYIIYIIYLT